ncbi:MAG: glycerate kinase [Actinomycetota bacterium]|nr:glycerate kinase [Actinomycetota bacterium]
MRVLVAPDKLKGCLTAREAAEAITGVRLALPEAFLRLLPVADGGDGTVEALLAAGAQAVSLAVDPYEVTVAFLPGPPRTAVAEVAQVGGLRDRRPTPDEARAASSFDAGRLLRAVLDLNPERVVLGIGGTASTDAGAGALVALGARLLDATGRSVRPGLEGLFELSAVDLSGLDGRLSAVDIVIAADVESPLTGASGAAAVFGPQKGLAPDDVDEADAALARLADLVADAGGLDIAALPGAGAGGGLAGGLGAALRRPPVRGTEVVFALIGLDQALADADLVITAEGRLDEQSMRGKAPVALARRARDLGVPCLAVAGSVAVEGSVLRQEGIVGTGALLDLEPDLGVALTEARSLLRRATAELLEDAKGPAHEEPAP